MDYYLKGLYSDKQNRVRNLNIHSSVIFPTNREVNRYNYFFIVDIHLVLYMDEKTRHHLS